MRWLPSQEYRYTVIPIEPTEDRRAFMAISARRIGVVLVGVLAVAVALGLFAVAAQPATATHDNSKVKIDLKPPSATNTVGERHCVTATVKDTGHGNQNQDPTGVSVVFSVSGANPTPTDVVVTTVNGEAQCCYT